jgi:hypothetical protein
MSNKQREPDDDIDWGSIYERVLGSQEPPLSHHVLSRHLEHTYDCGRAWGRVYDASYAGDLLLIIVERFPDVYRKYYFIPRKRFEPAGRVFVPFWSYWYEDMLNGDGWFDRAELRNRIIERTDEDIPEWALEAVDEYLGALTPAYEPQQSMKDTAIRSDTRQFYEKISDIEEPSQGYYELPQDKEREVISSLKERPH